MQLGFIFILATCFYITFELDYGCIYKEKNMEIKVIGESFEITPAIREYITTKFSHIPTPDKMNLVEFRLGKNGDLEYHVKFSANCKHKNITLDVKSDTAYHAIDTLMKKIHTNFVKLKEQNNQHFVSAQH
jgi:ribosomal subunit interface protein